jgi:hypothetical protein
MRPSFFIAGAPKCATTSLYNYLREHPDVFMPYADPPIFWKTKEPHHFSPDLKVAFTFWSLDDYLALFANAGPKQIAGEASVFYLFSEEAPTRIKQFDPKAKVIIGLRHPVDWMYSYFHELLRFGSEDIRSFEEAVAAESDRAVGRRMPASTNFPKCLEYSKMARFSSYVERYYNVLGRENVFVFLLEDIARDRAAFCGRVTDFLNIKRFSPQALRKDNEAKTLPVTRFLELRLKKLMCRNILIRDTAYGIKKKFPQLFKIQEKIESVLPKAGGKPDAKFDRELRLSMNDEVLRLQKVLDRNLEHWIAR